MKDFLGEYGLIVVTALVILGFVGIGPGIGTQIGNAIEGQITELTTQATADPAS